MSTTAAGTFFNKRRSPMHTNFPRRKMPEEFKALRTTSGPIPRGSPMVMPMVLRADFDIVLLAQLVDPCLERLLELRVVQFIVNGLFGLLQRVHPARQNADDFKNINAAVDFH